MIKIYINSILVRLLSILMSLLFIFSLVFSVIKIITIGVGLVSVDVWVVVILTPFLILLFFSQVFSYIQVDGDMLIIVRLFGNRYINRHDIDVYGYTGLIGIKGYYFSVILKTGRVVKISLTSKACKNKMLDFLSDIKR